MEKGVAVLRIGTGGAGGVGVRGSGEHPAEFADNLGGAAEAGAAGGALCRAVSACGGGTAAAAYGPGVGEGGSRYLPPMDAPMGVAPVQREFVVVGEE